MACTAAMRHGPSFYFNKAVIRLAIGTLTFDDFVSNLAGLKKQYNATTDKTAQTGIRNQGVQLRSDALGQGFDLNDLESKSQIAYAGNDQFTGKQQVYAKQSQDEANSLYSSKQVDVKGAGVETPAVDKTDGQSGPMDAGQQADQYLQQLQSIMSDNTPYDPNTDPAYQSLQVTAQRGAKEASNRALAEANRRGISGGSIAQNQIASIEQGAVNKVQDLIPGLAQNFQAGKQTQIGNLTQLFNALTGKDQYERSFDIQEAGVTGNYMPDELENIFSEILGTKQAVIGTQKGSAEYQGYVDKNKALYDQLATMGIDPSFINGNVGYEDAQKAIAGFKNPTVNMQEMLYNKEQDQKAIEYKTEQDKKAFDYKIATDDWDRGFKISQEKWNQYAEGARLADADATRSNTETWRKHLKDKDLTEKQGNTATNGYMSSILDSNSREEALDYIFENQTDIVNDGANVDKILGAINSKWPTPKAETSGGILNPTIQGILNP